LAQSATFPKGDLIGTRQATEDFLLQQLKQGSPGKKTVEEESKDGWMGKLEAEARLNVK
jgi:hypothetical protein